jgi:putative peptidoglycan lipid II flippase
LTEHRQVLQSASTITLATVISRILGYLRDQRITLLLGTSIAADSFILAFRIPNLLRRLIGEGALSASFVPVFTGYLARKSKQEIWEFADRAFWALLLILAPVTALGVIFSKQLIYLFTAFGAHHLDWGLAVYLNRIIFPYVLFIGLAALAMGILNSLRVFGLPASTPIVFNLTLILFSTALIYRPVMNWAPAQYRNPAVALAVGVLVGGALQFFMQVPALVRRGMRFRFQPALNDAGVRAVGRLMLPAFLGAGLYQINFFINTIFAMSPKMPAGSITSLYVADRVVELVLGSFAVAISTALLPTLSQQAHEGRFPDMAATFGFALRVVSFVTLPAAAGLIVLRAPIVRVLFQHGRFEASSTALTLRPLLFYSLGLPAFAAVKLLVPVFYSLHDTVTPMRVAAVALGVNIAGNLIFLHWLWRSLSNGGPALATSLAAYINIGALFVIFRRRFGRVGGWALLGSFARTVACVFAMSVACVGMLRWVNFDSLQHFVVQAGMLAGMILVSVGIYLLAARALGCDELDEVIGYVRNVAGARSAA